MGIIELRPQISVSAQEPIEKAQPFSVPFKIENTGYLSFFLVRPFCYYIDVESGAMRSRKSTSHTRGSNDSTLDRNESKTIFCNLVRAPNAPVKADIAIVVDYRPWRSFPHTFRKYFRFTGAYIDNWQWTAQPSEEIQKDADIEIEEHMRQTPDSR